MKQKNKLQKNDCLKKIQDYLKNYRHVKMVYSFNKIYYIEMILKFIFLEFDEKNKEEHEKYEDEIEDLKDNIKDLELQN